MNRVVRASPYSQLSRVLVTRNPVTVMFTTSTRVPSWGSDVLHIFLVNRSIEQSASIQIAITGVQIKSLRSADLVTGPSASAANTFEKPNTIGRQQFRNINLVDEKAVVELPPLSVAAISFDVVNEP